MKLRLLALAPIVIVFQSASSQELEYGFPLEAPADPRSVAMGESFVSIPSNPAALSCNPAGLSGLRGIYVSYGKRNLDWVSDGWSISSFNAALSTNFGVFALQYNRKVLGTEPIYWFSPFRTDPSKTFAVQDFTLGYAIRLPLGLSLGISGKYFDFSESDSKSLPVGFQSPSISPVSVFDLGANYTLPAFHDQSSVEDSITVGVSYQNIGSRWWVPSFSPAVRIPDWYWKANGLPQFLRLGVSYGMRITRSEEGMLSPFAAVLSGEFRSLRTGHDPFTGSSYWGLGLEFTVYDILSLRGGASFKPYNDFEGRQDKVSFRYGAGIRLPMKKMGIGLPVSFSFQYTVVPLNTEIPSVMGDDVYYGNHKGSPLPTYAFEIQYDGFPW